MTKRINNLKQWPEEVGTAKRINKPEQLPERFNLERYDALLDLTCNEFWEQVGVRARALSWLDEREGKPVESVPFMSFFNAFVFDVKKTIGQTLSGEVITKPRGLGDILASNAERMPGVSIFGKMFDEKTATPPLGKDKGVCPITHFDLILLYEESKKQGFFEGDTVEWQEYQEKLALSGFSGPTKVRVDCMTTEVSAHTGKREIVVRLDLAGATDEEIIGSIKGLLPKWRSRMGAEEPALESGRIGESTLPKMFNDRLIPAMDLMIWERVEGTRITKALLERVLFPNSIRGGVMQTVSRGIESVRSPDFVRLLGLFLKNNPHLKDRKMADQMEIYRG